LFTDDYYMRKALALAERGRGDTSPNPLVGALVVDNAGVIVGRGAHLRAGGPHAEVLALTDAGPRARGATLYCTLEPCSHTGKTGPCAPLVTAASIRRAVIAMEDPNPLVNGAGLRHLHARGVEVTVGVLAAEAARQNEAFLTAIRRRRPFGILKAALSLDGCVAAAAGVRTMLTGAAANRIIHRQRAEVDAIGVGVGTVLADDPLLTPRGAYRSRPLTRVIFDRRLRTPPSARIFSSRPDGPILVVATARGVASEPDRVAALGRAGAGIVAVEDDSLQSAMNALYRRGVASIVLEGGPRLHQAALEAGIVDLIHLYVAPRRLESGAVPWMPPHRFAIGTLGSRAAAWFGDDLRVEGHVHRAD
jgi:diaminohydroxyphosphoribosylaminopyrimidine deaminase/5-amino-6-(5-phosphoribosylamino)uracil reductase